MAYTSQCSSSGFASANRYSPDPVTHLVTYTGPCPVCPNRFTPERIVRGDGHRHASIAFIGEKPGKDEHWRGRPFVGPAGRTLNDVYLPVAGCDREHVYVSNACKCWELGKGDNPTPEEAAICAGHHLAAELAGLPNLKHVVLMGAVAYGLAGTGKTLEMEHGRPFELVLIPGDGDVERAVITEAMGVYHPAAGLHDATMVQDIRADFKAVGEWVAGELEVPTDERPGATYSWWNGWSASTEIPVLAIDTEVDPVETRTPWCWSFSAAPGTGYIAKAGDSEAVWRFNAMLKHCSKNPRFAILMHHAKFDKPVVDEIGLDIPWDRVICTMAMAYHRGLPQGLKVLAYRLCGMEMEEYDDVVRPYADAAGIGWLGQAAEFAQEYVPLPPVERYVNKNGKECNRRGAAWHKRIARIVNDYEKAAESGGRVDPRERWEKLDEEVRAMVEVGIGEMPGAGVSVLPEEKVVRYAGRDADACLRVYLKMLEIKEPEVESAA